MLQDHKLWVSSWGQQHTMSRNSSPVCAQSWNHEQHTQVLIHENHRTRRENSGRGEAETSGDNEEGREQRAVACRDLRETGAGGDIREHRAVEGRHTSVTETNRLPSALVAVPSLSKLKNKGRGNREQLVTFKNLKSKMLFATKKAKVQFKIKLKRKQVQQRSSPKQVKWLILKSV